ncbi:NTP transferase domain-containing protein [Candidatus Pacearchaeota archaeon]|nr:NTP transferase domain-containing protein [Candidatus Pacearchaeota archaeon]
MKVVILAGGEGKRLRPYTLVLPKPLLPIKDKPILDIVLERLKHQGIVDIFLSVNYKSKLFEMIYGDGKEIGMNIKYIKENVPLGTAGSLYFIKDEIKESFFVTNGDIISELDIKALEEFHKKIRADITVVTRKIETQIQFGVLKKYSDRIVEWSEKPKIDSEISAGMYMINPLVLGLIKENEFCDMPTLVRRVMENGGNVFGFEYSGKIYDIGHLEEYEKVCEEFGCKDKKVE